MVGIQIIFWPNDVLLQLNISINEVLVLIVAFFRTAQFSKKNFWPKISEAT